MSNYATIHIVSQIIWINVVDNGYFRVTSHWIMLKNERNRIEKCMFQRRRCCAFDSPGLPNDSAGYPGLMYVVWGTTPYVLRFFWLIRHERFHCKRAFIEKAQHRWRWISLRTFTRGRLVPRQPRAIKRTTRTELHHAGIAIAKYIHGNTGIKPMALRHEQIYIAKHVHWNTSMTPTALRRYNIYNGGYIPWNISAFWRLFIRMLALIVL